MSDAKVKIDLDATGMGSVAVNGEDMSNVVAGVDMRATAGELNRVELLVPAVDVTIMGDADVRVLLGGIEFSWEDVDKLLESPPDEPHLTDIAERLACILPPRKDGE